MEYSQTYQEVERTLDHLTEIYTCCCIMHQRDWRRVKRDNAVDFHIARSYDAILTNRKELTPDELNKLLQELEAFENMFDYVDRWRKSKDSKGKSKLWDYSRDIKAMRETLDRALEGHDDPNRPIDPIKDLKF